MSRRISVTDLRVGMYVRKLDVGWLRHPFFRSSFLLTDPNDIKEIIGAGIHWVWIDEPNGEQTVETESVTPNIVIATAPSRPKNTDKTCSIAEELERARKICRSAKDQVQAMFQDARLGKAIDPATTVPIVRDITDSVARNPSALVSVARLKTHDDYTYLHSVAVCALMSSVSRQLGFNEEQVFLAGTAGLMHDLGKAVVPLEILNKRGALSDAEFDIVKGHPFAGAELLKNGGAAIEVQDVALHHHEKINGRGYPHALKNDEISVLARMGAVCDVYDAITSERAYKNAWDPAQAIAHMTKWEGHFDKEIFYAFVKAVGIYPVGSLVRLSSGRLAIVVEPSASSLLKPKVRVFFSTKSNATIPIELIDLSGSGCGDQITGLEDQACWDFSKYRNLEELWLK